MAPQVHDSPRIREGSAADELTGAWAKAPCEQVTRLAADILGTPIALLSLPRAEEYRFRVNIGMDGHESVPRRIAFCAYTMLGTDVLVVPDARVDPRFEHNPLVLGGPHIVTYVGAPLVSSRGVTLGTLCCIDSRPREFSRTQLDQLRAAAHIATWLLEAEASARAELAASADLSRRLEDSREAERERLAIALHEGVAQDLFALRLQLQGLRRSGAWDFESDARARADGAAFTRALDRTISDVCQIANGIAPRGPVTVRIADAVRQLAQEVAEKSGLRIQVHEAGAVSALDPAVGLLLLRTVRAALAHVAGHARACHVSIIIENGADTARVRVVDDGAGAGEVHAGGVNAIGLAELRVLAEAAGGSLTLGRNMRGGTTLCMQVPHPTQVLGSA